MDDELQERELIQNLTIPPEFDTPDDEISSEVSEQLDLWKSISLTVLRRLLSSPTSSSSKPQLLYAVSPFLAQVPWSSSVHKAAAQALLDELEPDIIASVLKDLVKPLFIATPHPWLNLDTGRKRANPAGGHAASFDMFESQRWKANPGIAFVLIYCIERISASQLESLWPLLIPPIMSILDDHEPKWRLRGVTIVTKLFEVIPSDILERTGVRGLFMESLNKTMLFTRNPHTPDIIRSASFAILKLIEKTTPPCSEARFNDLCLLLGKTIIGSLWVTSSSEESTMEATYNVLPLIISQMGIGVSRYLAAIIPQLAWHVTPQLYEVYNTSSVVAALNVMKAVIDHCPQRIPHWRWDILDAICKRWVLQKYGKNSSKDEAILGEVLREVCKSLVKALNDTPEAMESMQKDISLLLKLDTATFTPLFQ